MFKKFLSLAMALMMIMSIAAVAGSAAQVEVPEVGAEATVAEQGAENDAASTGALDTSKCFNFDVSTTGWADFGAVGFYVYQPGGDAPIPWGSKKLFKSEETSSGIWSYDPAENGMDLADGTQYAIIFVNQNSGGQTYNLMFDTSCLGDTAYCTGNQIENPEDSNKTATEARWRNSSLGPQKIITSIGNVVGETIASNTTPVKMFTDFLTNTLGNARTFSGKDDQTLLDDTAKALDLTKDDVESAIKDAGVTTEWSKDKSSLSGGSGSGNTSSSDSGSGSSAASGTGSTGSKSSTTTSSAKTGSASNTQTGQTETMLFIMLGVMVVAAGVIFFARKRERA